MGSYLFPKMFKGKLGNTVKLNSNLVEKGWGGMKLARFKYVLLIFLV